MTDKDFDLFPSPCYIMEEELLRKNLTLIKSVADRAGVEIILAFKSFAMWRSFPIFREYVEHSTASSVYEARLALEEFGSKAHTYSPAYTEADFPEIMRCSSHITFNSLAQFRRFYPMIQAAGQDISCGIRVNPEYSEVETELYNPCAPGTRFGVMAEQLPDVLPQGIDGFHCHCHCESSSYELERTLEHLEAKFSRWFPQIKWLNLGGGHLMTRKDYDVEHLIRLLRGLKERYPHLRIILEPGPVAVNSATYVGYKIEGAEGAAASTLAVCLPSFVVIYLISLVFDRFLQLSAVASAFRGIQVCVIYLILSSGMKMLKSLSGTAFNRIIVAGVVAAMVGCSLAAVSFSSLYYILLCGAAGVLLYLLRKLRKEEKA